MSGLKDGDPILELPIEESLLPVLFAIDQDTCNEAMAVVYSRFLNPESSLALLLQNTGIGKLRDAFQASLEKHDWLDKPDNIKHNYRVGALYADASIAVHARKSKITIPTVHSMDVRKLKRRIDDFIEEGGTEDGFAFHGFVQPLVDKAQMLTNMMTPDERIGFSSGVKDFGYCLAEVAITIPKGFTRPNLPGRSTFSVSTNPLTQERQEQARRDAQNGFPDKI